MPMLLRHQDSPERAARRTESDQSREVPGRERGGDALGKPIMVHPGGTTIPLDEILGRLVRGDVVTHVITAGVKARWHLGRVRASAQRWIGG